MDKKLQNTDGNYLFNVDILINARTNPLALQYLLEILNNNSDKVTDFKINSGLELGRSIDTLLRSAKAALNQEPVQPPVPFKMPVKPDSKRQGRPKSQPQLNLQLTAPLMLLQKSANTLRTISWSVCVRTGPATRSPCPAGF